MGSLKYRILSFLGFLLILIGFVAVLNSFYAGRPFNVLWFSYFTLFFVGWGILKKSSFITQGQTNVILIPHLIWIIDFFYVAIFSKNLWGATEYLFKQTSLISNFVSLSHLIILPIAFFALYVLGTNTKSLLFSTIEILLVFTLTFLLTSPEKNINCIYTSCFQLPFEFSNYFLAWWVLILLMTILSYLFLLLIFPKKRNKKVLRKVKFKKHSR